MRFTSWKELLKEEMKRQGESGKRLKGCNQSDIGMLAVFGTHWKLSANKLTAWTEDRVYFSVTENDIVKVKSTKRRDNV